MQGLECGGALGGFFLALEDGVDEVFEILQSVLEVGEWGVDTVAVEPFTCFT